MLVLKWQTRYGTEDINFQSLKRFTDLSNVIVLHFFKEKIKEVKIIIKMLNVRKNTPCI